MWIKYEKKYIIKNVSKKQFVFLNLACLRLLTCIECLLTPLYINVLKNTWVSRGWSAEANAQISGGLGDTID
jgi:hypothetical protein